MALLNRNKSHLQQTAREEGISTRPPLTTLRQITASIIWQLRSWRVHVSWIMSWHLKWRSFSEHSNAWKKTRPYRLYWENSRQMIFEICSRLQKKKPHLILERSTTPYGNASRRMMQLRGYWVYYSACLSHMRICEHTLDIYDGFYAWKKGGSTTYPHSVNHWSSGRIQHLLEVLIGKRARDNFEGSEPCDEQHGFRPHRSSVDAVMLKLLTFESARMQKCTLVSMQHDMMAHFDRMDPAMTSLYGSKWCRQKHTSLHQ